MRFNLELGDALLNKKYFVTVRINNREKINLPSNSYNYITYDFDYNAYGSSNFSLSSLKCNTKAILNNLSQGLRLKRNDYKLALVNNLDYPYYYYKIGNNVHIGTFNDIPQEAKKNGQILTFDVTSCSEKFLPLENSEVLIDPKDIISSKNITAILKEPSIMLIQNGGKFSEVYDLAGNKIGTLNNVVPYFEQENYRYLQVSLFPFDITFVNSYFTAKKLGNNYVGCISDENGKCRRFYELNPDYFGYEHDNIPGPYPYYYNLENFGNFLEVDMKVGELIDLEKGLEEKIRILEDKIKQLNAIQMVGMPGPPGLNGEPGSIGKEGERGLPGDKGLSGPKGDKGDTGPKGDQGDIGPQGPKGVDGASGNKGDKGDAPSATEIATELVISQKAKLGEAVLDAKDSSGKNLVTQVASTVVNLSPQDFVNKVDATKFTEGVVHKLSEKEAKNIVKDTVDKITSDATQQNNPDPNAFKKYEKFAEKLAELLVDRSNMNEEKANTLVQDKVSDWGLAKYLLLHSDLKEQTKARNMVEERIDKEKLVEYLFEYTKLKGNADQAKTIVEGIVNDFLNTKVDELGKAVLEAKDDQDKKILVNDPALQKGIAEELRKNPGQIKGENGAQGMPGPQGPVGPEGKIGAPGTAGLKGETGPKGVNGTQGLPGEKGLQGIKGDRGEIGTPGTAGLKGEIGPQGEKGDQGPIGLNGTQGEKGDVGLPGMPGIKGDLGLKGDRGEIGAPGMDGLPGLQGFNGMQGEKGAQGDKGEIGAPGMDGLPGLQGFNGTQGEKGDQGPRGFNGTQGEKGEIGAPGTDGVPGIPGPQGFNGTQGDMGAKGVDGVQGLNGQKGAQGLKGDQGDVGAKGVDGVPGMPGLKGDTGPKGNQGDMGAKGVDGIPGPQGLKGDQGIQGFNGTPGAQGLQGEKGAQGLKGDQGDRGDVGLPGAKGDTGPQGFNGTQGEKGDVGLPGMPGIKGDKGELGIVGAPGANGLPGMPGPKGEQGIQGPRGFNGTQGVQGEKGDVGSQGLKGDQGIQGLKGVNGTQGVQGEKGPQGPVGPKGIDGIPGIDGAPGPVGPQGLKGDQGDRGEIGVPGIPGPQGLVGPKGEDGLLGMPGPRGKQGDTGLSGMPGPQGLQGEKGAQGLKGDQGDMGAKGVDGLPGIPGIKGDTGEQDLPGPKGDKGIQGPIGLNGTQGEKGDEGDLGPIGPQGPRGDQGSKGQAGRSGLNGSKGDTGLIGMPGPKGEDGVGAAVANQFLSKINQTKIEIQNARKAAEDAKSASENFAKEAQGAKEEVVGLHGTVVNLTRKTENFSKAAKESALETSKSKSNVEALYGQIQDMFCGIKPTDPVCPVSRKKREIEKLNNPPVTSGASRSSSWVNVFTNTIVGAITGAFQPVSSFKPAIGSNNSQPSKAITTQGIDINGTLSLLDVFIRKITGQKYISTAEQPASSSEMLGCSSQIAEEFERVLKYAAIKSGISVKNLSFNYESVQSAILQHINNGQYSKIPKSLYSFAKGACPNYKQIDKFLAIFKDHMERALGSNEQPSNTKEIVTGSERPRSFMSDIIPPSSLNAINQTAVGYLRQKNC